MHLIQRGTVHVGTGEVLKDCDVLVSEGKIVRVAHGIPAHGADVVDALDCHLFPGFIDPTSAIGALGIPTSYLDVNERTNPITPELNIKYSMDPDELNRQEFYKSGITTIGLAPGNANVIGGQMAVFKTAPMKMQTRMLKEHAGLKCCVTADPKYYGKRNQQPMTKMGIFQLLENSLRLAKETEPDKRSAGQKVLAGVLAGEQPLFVSAELKSEMDSVLHLLQDLQTPLYFVDAYEFEHVAEALVNRKIGLVLGNISSCSQVTKHNMHLSKLRQLVENGNLIAFTNTCGGSSEGREVLLWTAIDVYRAGVEAEEVVKMLTINPARMLGVDDRVGSLEVGKDADISIFNGHPITSYTARVIYSMINGEVVLT